MEKEKRFQLCKRRSLDLISQLSNDTKRRRSSSWRYWKLETAARDQQHARSEGKKLRRTNPTASGRAPCFKEQRWGLIGGGKGEWKRKGRSLMETSHPLVYHALTPAGCIPVAQQVRAHTAAVEDRLLALRVGSGVRFLPLSLTCVKCQTGG
eukprot:757020-Hanusia_phi.AAC.1